MEYRVALPQLTDSMIPDLLKSVSPQWLLSSLFSFIRTRQSSKPTGEPEWPLSAALAVSVTEGEEELCQD